MLKLVVDVMLFKKTLLEAQLPMWRVARRMGVAPSTLSNWVRGVSPAPEDLQTRLKTAIAEESKTKAA